MFEIFMTTLWGLSVLAVSVGLGLATFWNYLPQYHLRKIGWMAMDNRIPPPEIEGNSITLGIPGEVLLDRMHPGEGPATGTFSIVQWIKLPDDVPAMIIGNDEVLPSGVRIRPTFLRSGWYGEIVVEVENREPQKVSIPANAPFVRVQLVGPYSFKVVDMNDLLDSLR